MPVLEPSAGATKELHVPERKPATDLNMDEELCDTIRKSVELFAADGAADEQLAGTLLKDSGFFPNMKMNMVVIYTIQVEIMSLIL